MKKTHFKRVLSLVIAFVMLLSMMPATRANAAPMAPQMLQPHQEEPTKQTAIDLSDRLANLHVDAEFDPDEIVRVSIVLEEKSTIQAGFSTMDIASNNQAMAYNKDLQNKQESVEQLISKQVLGGEPLDVVWNLTLVGNIISANVPFGKIEQIRQVRGVAGVVIENEYLPCEVEKESSAAINQFAATGMTGSNVVWSNGYTGAGSRIAVIDTGTDTDHLSFNNGAFLYALQQNALAEGLSFEEYVAGLNLLDAEELAAVLPNLNIYERDNSLTAEDLYLTEKLAFAVNYVDSGAGRLNVTHDNDYQTNHGSHVAGIATANRFVPKDDSYVDALQSVKAVGVAPDAQLITMKVFGNTALRDSDYMAAVEDAILLGCDSVNLSLGTLNPGHAFNDYYAELLNYMTQTDTVVIGSAGNEGKWTDMTMFGTPYSDDVVFDTVGAPGSYNNFFTVASVENDGIISVIFRVAGLNVMYVENTDYGNRPLSTIDTSVDGSGTAYEYIFIDGIGNEEDYAGMDLQGKVVFCSRGVTNFADKANTVMKLGAAAIIVYNNTVGDFGMNLTGYTYNNPAVSVSQAVADHVRENSTQATTAGGLTYYTGTIEIFGTPQVGFFNSEYFTMSDFSSWGVPGDLSIKPEITAPGGMIYSVYGSTPDLYGTENYGMMSGTSMAAPQIAGMVALLAQYMRENGLSEQTGLNLRTLAQSLLMSTAVPMLEETSNSYYPIMQQGSGLARVDLATLASSYVMVVGQDDGKVKAEVGDDPLRTGVYSFSFVLNNLTGEAQDYALRADLFRQGVYDPGMVLEGRPYDFTIQDTRTVALESNATFTFNGTSGSTVTVPADGSVTIEVELSLTEEAKAELDELFADGAFIQAYVFAEEVTDELNATVHSIPVLAFYGNWTDPNMFDRGTYIEMWYGISDLVPYLYQAIGNGNALTIDYGDGNEYYFGGNPIATDLEYLPERNSFNSLDDSMLKAQYFTLIRNAGDMTLQVVDKETGEVYFSKNAGEFYSAFFNSSYYVWDYDQQGVNMFWKGTDANGQPLPEGTVVEVVLTAAPEYYEDANGEYNYDALGHGATLVTEITIDNTAPEMKDYVLDVTADGATLTVTALDNEYIAAVVLTNKNGTISLATAAANQMTAGTVMDIVLDLTGVSGKSFQLSVYDYALNVTTYQIELDLPEIERPYFTVMDYQSGTYYGLNADGSSIALAGSDRPAPMAAEFVDGYVFEITDGAKLYVAEDSDLNSFEYLCELDPTGEWAITSFVDLAYNYADGKLYGLFYSELNGEKAPAMCTIDMFTGKMEVLYEMPIDVNNMAIDGEGNFYSVTYGKPYLYTYTLEGAAYGEVEYIGEVGYYGTDILNSLAWDHNTDKLYWAFPNTLLEINVETAKPTLLSYFMYQMVGLYIRPENYTGETFAPVDEVLSVELDFTENRTMVGSNVILTEKVWPWNVSDNSVTWTSSNESVATVDQNGTVTGLAVGTAVITVTSNLDPTKSASCVIEVITLDKTLTGIVWDENGDIWWSEFNVGNLPNFDKIANVNNSPDKQYLAAIAVAPDGTIYASSTDVSTGYLESALYTVDPDTLELNKIGDVNIEGKVLGASDIAYAPNLLGGTIMGTYGSSLLVIDPSNGNYIADYTMFMYGLNAITYVGSDRFQDYGFDTYIDWFFLIDTYGFVYLMGFLADDAGNVYYLEHPATSGGIFTVVNYQTDTIYFGSAYYDGEFLYWSVYSESKDVSTLFVIDTVGSRKAYNMGDFGPNIWPVGGLSELDFPFSEEILLGDVNGDGNIDTTDAKLIMQLDLGLISESDLDLAAADVNGDGLVDTTDAKLVMQLDLGLIDKFPAEG